MNYLYRGVSARLHQANGGRLVPKKFEPFTYTFHWGEKGLKYGCGARYGSSEINAVLRHQLNQEGFHTSGVSTTPIFDRALFYATSNGNQSGYVYKIDRSLLSLHGIKEFIVADFAVYPSVTEDQEVILVAPDFGVLPESIVVEVIPV